MKVIFASFVILSLALSCISAPTQQTSNQRQKRVSDQRLAELETLLALARIKNRKYMSLPVGFGLIDVQKIGRKKRSVLSPFDRFAFPRELSLKVKGLPLRSLEAPRKVEDGASFEFPVIEEVPQGWWGRESNPTYIQEEGNYV